MKRNNKIIVSFIAVLMIFTLLTACNNTTDPLSPGTTTDNGVQDETGVTTETPVTADTQEDFVVVTIATIVNEDIWNNEFWDTAVGRTFLEKTGVKINFVVNDMERFQMLLATGDLPDMLTFDSAPPNFEETLINNNHVIPLEELFEQYAPNYLERHRPAMEFSKRFWSNGTDTFYFIPVRTTGPVYTGAVEDFGLIIRWDLYSELGYPPINNLDDLLDVLEQMVALEPVTPDGKKTYGVSTFNDWGTYWQFAMYSQIWAGSMYDVPGWFTDTVNIPGQPLRLTNALTDENSVFWQQTEFLFKANQRGLLDPDSFMQNWDQMGDKLASGAIFLTTNAWQTGWTYDTEPDNFAAGRGYMNIPIPGHGVNTRVRGHAWEGLIGLPEHRIGITTNNQNPEKTVGFLDFLSTPEGGRLIFSGVEGEHWDYIDGIPQIRPDLIDLRGSDREAFEALKIGTAHNAHMHFFASVTGHTTHPDGHYMNLWYEDNVLSRGLSPVQQAYSDFYGVQYPTQIIKQMLDKGEIFTVWQVLDELAYATFNPIVPESLRLVESRVESLALTLFAEAILASDPADFAAKKVDAIAQFEASGINDVFEVYLQAWNDAHEAVRGLR